MNGNSAYVIVGASLAGAKAAETLRGEGFGGPVVLIGDETERPYERPPLSKDYLMGKAERESIFVHPAEWYAEHRTRKGPPPPDPALLKAAVEAAARELHAEGKLQATPGPDGLYLLWK